MAREEEIIRAARAIRAHLGALLGEGAAPVEHELMVLLLEAARGARVHNRILKLLAAQEATRRWVAEYLRSSAADSIRIRHAQPLDTSDVLFTTYYPQRLLPGIWKSLLAYVHVPRAMDAVAEDASRRWEGRGESPPRSRSAATQSIRRGSRIEVVPDMPGCRFNPERVSFDWLEDWHRAEFRVQAMPGQKAGMALNGRLNFYVGPVLVGETKIWTYVPELDAADLAEEIVQAEASAIYQSIFVSYSHRDTAIVEHMEKAYVALGLEYLRDVKKLRSGEAWNAALLEMIDRADIFQLYWSAAASRSEFVEQEWRRALRRSKSGFIRPLFWEAPMEPPPPELRHFHFARLALSATD